MEKTPHVMLVGSGAQQFAVAEGFKLEEQNLSKDAEKNYENWLKKSEYKPPAINIEQKNNHGPFAPYKLDNGEWGPMKSIGSPINTAGNEKTPFIHPDNKTFYFSSDALSFSL